MTNIDCGKNSENFKFFLIILIFYCILIRYTVSQNVTFNLNHYISLQQQKETISVTK